MISKKQAKALRDYMAEDFITWADTYFANPDPDGPLNNRYQIEVIRKDFLDQVKNDWTRTDVRFFSDCIESYCHLAKLSFNPHMPNRYGEHWEDRNVNHIGTKDVRYGKEYITVANEKWIESEYFPLLKFSQINPGMDIDVRGDDLYRYNGDDLKRGKYREQPYNLTTKETREETLSSISLVMYAYFSCYVIDVWEEELKIKVYSYADNKFFVIYYSGMMMECQVPKRMLYDTLRTNVGATNPAALNWDTTQIIEYLHDSWI